MNIKNKQRLTHQQLIDDLQELFAEVLRFVPELERVYGNVKIYIERNLGDKSP